MNAVPATLVVGRARAAALQVEADAITLRTATVDEAGAIHSLIVQHLAEGHLLPRELEEIEIHAHRFVVAVQDDRILACAELAPLSRDVSEVRSAVVSHEARGLGLGRQVVEELLRRADTRR